MPVARRSKPSSRVSLKNHSRGVTALPPANWIEFPRKDVLSEAWSNIIAGKWLDNPHMNYAVAVLFSGCVLFNPANGVSVLALVVEAYGRGVYIDAHSEEADSGGMSVSSISQPPSSGRYPHACVFGIREDTLEQRLVIGCKIFNILVTECWRLDGADMDNRAFTAGSCLSAFPFEKEDSIMIFVDKKSFALASNILSGKFVPDFEMDLLRQVNTKMCSLDSYRMGRASWYKISNTVSAMPATIFTLNIVRSRDADTTLLSVLFCKIAHAVNKNGRKATIERSMVKDIYNRMTSGDGCELALKRILGLFGDEDSINIINIKKDSGLEKMLDEMAVLLSQALFVANKDVVVPKLTKDMRKLCEQGPSRIHKQ